jgi:hypothetical protein
VAKLSEIKAGKNRVVSGFWTPEATPIVGPAPFDVAFTSGLTLSNSDYTATGWGYSFTGLGLPHDATLRGHTVTLDITGIADEYAFYLASLNGDDITSATSGQVFILIWSGLNSNFDVMAGNTLVDTPTALGSMAYTSGQELAFGNDNAGNLSLYKDGVLQFSMVATTPMVDASVSFGVYIATGGPTVFVADIVQTPAFPVLAITQYTTSIPGPINYPADREGKIFEVEGVAPGGIVVESLRLKNGMWAEFDQNEALVPPLEPETPYLTQAAADAAYSPLVTHFYSQLTAPGVNDDSTTGASRGSKWQDTSVTPNEWYLCDDASVGAAVWGKVSLTVDELGSMALQNAGSGPTEYRNNSDTDSAISSQVSSSLSSQIPSYLLDNVSWVPQPSNSTYYLSSGTHRRVLFENNNPSDYGVANVLLPSSAGATTTFIAAVYSNWGTASTWKPFWIRLSNGADKFLINGKEVLSSGSPDYDIFLPTNDIYHIFNISGYWVINSMKLNDMGYHHVIDTAGIIVLGGNSLYEHSIHIQGGRYLVLHAGSGIRVPAPMSSILPNDRYTVYLDILDPNGVSLNTEAGGDTFYVNGRESGENEVWVPQGSKVELHTISSNYIVTNSRWNIVIPETPGAVVLQWAATTFSVDYHYLNRTTKFTNAAATTVYLDGSVYTPVEGNYLVITQYGTGTITFVPQNGVTLQNTYGHTKTAGQYAVVNLLCVTDGEWVLSGATAL